MECFCVCSCREGFPSFYTMSTGDSGRHQIFNVGTKLHTTSVYKQKRTKKTTMKNKKNKKKLEKIKEKRKKGRTNEDATARRRRRRRRRRG